jgi:hypothetical protein
MINEKVKIYMLMIASLAIMSFVDQVNLSIITGSVDERLEMEQSHIKILTEQVLSIDQILLMFDIQNLSIEQNNI